MNMSRSEQRAHTPSMWVLLSVVLLLLALLAACGDVSTEEPTVTATTESLIAATTQAELESVKATATAQAQTLATAQNEVEQQRKTVEAQHLAALAQRVMGDDEDSRTLSVLLAVESLRLSPTLEGDVAMRRGAALLPPSMVVDFGEFGSVLDVALSHDGQWILTLLRYSKGSSSGYVEARDTITGEEILALDKYVYVEDITLSPDDRWLAATTYKRVQVWETSTWQEVLNREYEEPVGGLVFSPDGNLLATSDGQSAHLWEVGTWQELTQLSAGGDLSYIAFSPDNRLLAAGGEGGIIRVWEVETGKEVARLTHEAEDMGPVRKLAFGPDGQWLASTVEDDHNVLAWDTITWQEAARLEHQTAVDCMTFAPDNRWLATGSGEGTVKVWDVGTWKEVNSLEHRDLYGIVFSPDGKWMTISSRRGVTSLRETDTWREVTRLYGRVVTFTPDSQRLIATIARAYSMGVWEVSWGLELAQISTQHGIFSPDGQRIAYRQGNFVQVIEVTTGHEIARMEHQGVVSDLAFSPDGRWLATASKDTTARVWEAATGEEISRVSHEGGVQNVIFSPDGLQVISIDSARNVLVWEAATGREISRMQVPEMPSPDDALQALSPDGRLVATGVYDVRLWDVATGEEVLQVKVDSPSPKQIAFSPDGRLVFTGGEDKTVRVFDVTKGQEIVTLYTGHSRSNALFSPDGRWMAVMSYEPSIENPYFGTTTVWDVDTWEVVAQMPTWSWAVAFSPDGRWLMTGGRDIWDTSTWQQVAQISHFADWAAFSPDGRLLLTGNSGDGYALLWAWQPGDLIDKACSRLPRNMTHEEWAEYMGGEPYRVTCPNLPEGREWTSEPRKLTGSESGE